MGNNNFKIVNADTDSITITKIDQSPFSKEEQFKLLEELNSLFPDNINWEHDGIYSKIIVFKAKNYVLLTEDKKIKYKGSSLKSPALEPALLEFLDKIVQAILIEETNYVEIYNRYVKEITNIQDIKRWASRKTLTEKTFNSSRANETKLTDAIEGTEYVEGDRVYTYFDTQGKLVLAENYNFDYDKNTYLKKLFKASERFEPVLGKGIFLNYSLKRNQKALGELINGIN